MAQGDIFSSIFNPKFESLMTSAKLNADQIRSTQAELIKQQMNIYSTRKDILKTEKATLNIYKRIKDIGGKIIDQNDKIYKTKRLIKLTEGSINEIKKRANLVRKSDAARAAILDEMANKAKVINEMNKISLAQARQTIPILGKYSALQGKTFQGKWYKKLGLEGKGGGFFNIIGKISDGLIDLFSSFTHVLPIIGEIGGVLFKIGGTIVNLILAPIKKAFGTFLQIQGTVGNLAADLGLTHTESHALLQNMTGLALEASKFGGTIEDVATIFSEFSQTTGKNRFFSKEEVGVLTELGKGTGLGVQGATQLAATFDNIGVSLDKTIKLTNKARDMAARYNVNSAAVLKTYNELVTSLTGIGFGKGLDNLTKLAAKAQAMRFDIVSSTKAFTDAFFEPDKAAEAAAQMQVLGGAFAQSFGDPMQLAFESMNDPAKLADKFAGLVKGMVQKTAAGDFIIPPAARKQLQLASQALGQDYENIKNTAIEQAKITDKMAALGKQGIFSIKDEDKPALASLMKLNKDNKYEIRMSDGTTKLLENITDKRQLDAILDARNKNEKAAIERNNLAQRLTLIADRFMLGFSTVMTTLFGGSNFETFLEMIEKAGTELADMITNKLGGKNGFLEKISNVFNEISKIFGDKDKGVGQRIFEALSKLFKDFVVPLLSKIFEIITPLLSHGFGAIFDVLGNAIPDILGGSKLRNMGIEMQRSSLAKSPILQELYGGKENTEKVQKTLTDNLYSSAKSDFVKGNALTNTVGGVWDALLGTIDIIGGAFQWATGKETSMWDMSALRFRAAGNEFMDIFGGNDDQAAAFNNLINEGNTTASGKAFQEYYNLPTTNVKDALITPHGIVKGDRGDIWAAFQPMPGGTMGGGTSTQIEHTGTIRIESSDGKVVTWDQMYNARDMVGASLQSVQQSYNNGFGNYQNSNTLPIKPLV